MLIRWLRTGIVEFGFAIVGVQSLVLAGAVVIPGMSDIFLDMIGRVHIDIMHGGEIAVES